MVGIKDIAKAAGVSISTVSYALNGNPKITDETRAKIMKLAEEMNYVPNMAARTLKRQQTNIIGVYLTDYAGSFYGELLDGIKRGLEFHGYEMIVCSGKKSQLFIPEKMVDGAIVLDWTFDSEQILQFAHRGHKLVVLDREIEHANIRKVLLDNAGGTSLAIEQFANLRPEKLYLISGPTKGYDSQKRLVTSEKELNLYTIPYEIIAGNFTESSGYEAGEKIMKQQPQLPIHIFSFNDEMAVGLYKYFKGTNLKIGKDVSIIGFDNIEIGKYLRPPLATISYSKHRWGMLAAKKVVQLLQDEPTESELIYTTFVRRDSFLGKEG
ncbi:LacI family DNA-binding transcriptional regulator [Enterococcus italicus]|uniref:LacI family DNA-binding transcriptional regulator n=1 Tax=Enterococcus italicus TaxID=246144 RepID=UPI0020736E05|nr:LacI family DNA-binding transcriptional regulator [Enterococcus italicus]